MNKKIFLFLFLFIFLFLFSSNLVSAVASISNVPDVHLNFDDYYTFNVNTYASGNTNASTTLSFTNPATGQGVSLFGNTGGGHTNQYFSISLSTNGQVQILSYDESLQGTNILVGVGNSLQTQAGDSFVLSIGSNIQGVPTQTMSLAPYNLSQGNTLNFNNIFQNYEYITLEFLDGTGSGTFYTRTYFKYYPSGQGGNNYFSGNFLDIEDNSFFYSPGNGTGVYLNLYEGSGNYPGQSRIINIIAGNDDGEIETPLYVYQKYYSNSPTYNYVYPEHITPNSIPILFPGIGLISTLPMTSETINLFDYFSNHDPTLYNYTNGGINQSTTYFDMTVYVLNPNNTVVASNFTGESINLPLLSNYYFLSKNITFSLVQIQDEILLWDIVNYDTNFNYLFSPRLINRYPNGFTPNSGSLFFFLNVSVPTPINQSARWLDRTTNSLSNVFPDSSKLSIKQKWTFVAVAIILLNLFVFTITTITTQGRLNFKFSIFLGLFLTAILLFWFIAIGYISVTILVMLTLVIVMYLYLRSKGG